MSAGGAPDPRAMNAMMVERLLAGPAQPLDRDAYALRVLEVRGRRTGEVHRTPVGLLDRGGRRYLVCPDRTRDWPTNLLADPECAVLAGDERVEYTATEVGRTEAAETVAAYLAVVTVPWAVAAFAVEPGASVETLEAQVDRMAVFALSAR